MSQYLATISFDPNKLNPNIEKSTSSSISATSIDQLKREIFQYVCMESLRHNVKPSLLYYRLDIDIFNDEQEHINTALERHKKISPYHWHQFEGLYHPDWLFQLFTQNEYKSLNEIDPLLSLCYTEKFGLWLEIRFILRQLGVNDNSNLYLI